MTISDVNVRVQYNGNGTTDTFSVTFPFFEDEDLQVIQGTANNILTLGVDYTVTGGAVGGVPGTGSVVFTSPPANGTRITIRRLTAFAQLQQYIEGGAFEAKTMEIALDRAIMLVQQCYEICKRTVQLRPSNTQATAPFIINLVAGRLLRVAADGETIETDDTTEGIEALIALKADKAITVTRNGLVGGTGDTLADNLTFDVVKAVAGEIATGTEVDTAVTPKAAKDYLNSITVARGNGIIGSGDNLGETSLTFNNDVAQREDIRAATSGKMVSGPGLADFYGWLQEWRDAEEETVGIPVDDDPEVGDWIFSILQPGTNRLGLGLSRRGKLYFLRDGEDVHDPDDQPLVGGNPLWAKMQGGRYGIALWEDGTFYVRPDAASIAYISGQIDGGAVEALPAGLLGGNAVPGRGVSSTCMSWFSDVAEGRLLRTYLVRLGVVTPEVAIENVDEIDCVIVMGQSNAVSNAGAVVTSVAPKPNNALHLNSGGHSPGNVPFVPSTATDLKPAVETVSGSAGEGAGSSSMMRWLARKLNGTTGLRRAWGSVNCAIGDKTIEEISKGSAFPAYANGLGQFERFHDLAGSIYGKGVVCRWIKLFEGETASATAQNFADAAVQLRLDADTDVKAINSQAYDVHMLAAQISSDEDSVGVPNSWRGIQIARDAHPDLIHVASPRYWVTLVDNTHLDATSQAVMDEYFGRCAWRAIYQDTTTEDTSARIVKATIAGAAWTLRVRTPPDAGALYFETTIVPNIATTRGFRATDGGSPDTIVSVAIDNTPGVDAGTAYAATITVTLDGAPAGAAYLAYANGSGTTGLNRPAAWGNVAAHSSDLSVVDGRELCDFLEIWDSNT